MPGSRIYSIKPIALYGIHQLLTLNHRGITVKNSYKKIVGVFTVILALAAFMTTGCTAARENLVYSPIGGGGQKLDKPVKAALIPIADVREQTKAYPKQVIVQTDYSGNVSHDINDRTVDEVINGAVSSELRGLGLELVKVEGIEAQLDKDSSERIKARLTEAYPGVQVAFGGNIKDFMATSQRTLIANNIHVTASLQFYVLDVETGDLLWSDYKTEWDDVVASADHNYMIGQLNQAIVNLMQKSIRDNESMKALLMKVANRK